MKRLSIRFIYNFHQILWPSILFSLFLIYDFIFVFELETGRDVRTYIDDVRKINDYCNYYLVFISVLMGFLLTLPRYSKTKSNNHIPVAPFLVSLTAASINMIFLPVPYIEQSLWAAKFLWSYHVMCEQAVVIFTAFGLLGLLKTFMRQHPIVK